ncbi:MAG: cysteine desulfurase family protein [Methylovirgula sp.]|uniref:cysteine desulfurase family protein n=1 Tax=Methylovirgula sp. TaxID=1978224 RepID=UPI003075F793
MPLRRAYLDHNATSALRPAAREAMLAALTQTGNASSVHREGRAARAKLEAAREAVAHFVKTQPKNVYFTSGATEAANLVLTPELELDGNKTPFDVLLISAGEHACILQGHRFPAAKVEKLPLTQQGMLDLDALDAALARHAGARVLLALQAANNETGVLQQVAEAAGRVHAVGGALVCDAVQAAGKSACDFAVLGADVLVLSAHKIGGPQGVGALCFARDRHHIGSIIVRGGGQERGLRAGTENVAAIAGFAASVAGVTEAGPHEIERLAGLRDRLECDVLAIAPDAVFFGAATQRLPNTTNFAVPGLSAEVLLMALDLEGVAVSSGSACSSGKVKRSHVLEAMNVPSALADGAIRVSFGWSSEEDDVDMFRTAFSKAVETIRAKRVKPAA